MFTKKLRLAQYADSSIYNYRLKISQAALYLKKLPDNFTQADVDDYLTMLLDRNCYSLSFFKHTVFGMKDYYKYMGLKEPGGLVLPKVRKPKRLPRVLSQEQVKRLISLCDLYDKALLSTIYDCALRVSEACSLKWDDIRTAMPRLVQELSAHHHEDYQACPKSTTLHCLAHWTLTEAICEM